MLHSLRNETYVRLHELKELLWIDRATRFISVDFTVYNANLNLFSIAKYTNSVYCFLRCDYIVPFLKVLTISLTRERKRYLNPHPSYSHYIRVEFCMSQRYGIQTSQPGGSYIVLYIPQWNVSIIWYIQHQLISF